MDNPFQSPPLVDTPVLAAGREDVVRLRRIAERQRLMLFAILANLGGNVSLAFVGNIAMGVRGSQLFTTILLVLSIIALALFTLAAIVRLVMAVYESTALGVLCGLLSLFPCIGLITLLVVNQKATGELQNAGIKVGLMGANMNQFPRED